jgi:5-(carboxyamino)imidazole ribonucleotide synthase
MKHGSEQRGFAGATIGLVGGGQLGRMFALAAARLGCKTLVLDPEPNCPASIAAEQIVGSVHDADNLAALAERCDVVSFEIENVDPVALHALGQTNVAVHPAPRVLLLLQNKLLQKQFLRDAGLPTAEFIEASAPDAETFSTFGYPLVQKVLQGGYDGRGVAVLQHADQFVSHLPMPSLIERFVEDALEIGVMVARNAQGEITAYPPVEMQFHAEQNMLDVLLAPARITAEQTEAAKALAQRAVEALDGVGIFGVELFLTQTGELLINEIAPRTHNSGHHTLDACVTDQFEQHARAILGLPLGATTQHSPAAMVNLLGAPGHAGTPVYRGLEEALAVEGACVHLYGKQETRPHRKMGHATVVRDTLEVAHAAAVKVRDLISIEGAA